MKYIASVSWGKDSTAMLYLIIEKGLPLDEVIFFDTGAEFDAIYKVRDKVVKELLEPLGIKYTELKPSKPFFDLMLNHKHLTKKGTIRTGYGWCGGLCRWGTSQKLNTINKYCKNAIQYIGIAYDEEERYKRLTPNKIAPLYNYKITEENALLMCYERGILFDKLYTILKRVSCWCCRNKNLHEIENYKNYLPEYFNKLIKLEEEIGEPMKPPYTLKERFK